MRKRSLIVFGGSSKSLNLIRALNPQSVFWLDDICSKQNYIDALSTLDHQTNAIVCVNWPFITPESELISGNIYTIHESLLPSFSGCAPVNWSIIEGSPLFGITLFRQTKEIDAGQSVEIIHVNDRPFNDSRYAVDDSKIRNLGWSCSRDLEEDLPSMIDWYRKNYGRWSSSVWSD